MKGGVPSRDPDWQQQGKRTEKIWENGEGMSWRTNTAVVRKSDKGGGPTRKALEKIFGTKMGRERDDSQKPTCRSDGHSAREREKKKAAEQGGC